MSQAFPRTLLLTWQRPDGRYAGAEVIRKILRCLPREQIRWAYLADPIPAPWPEGPESVGFAPNPIHWRLRDTAWRYLYMHHLQAGCLAGRIAEWIRPFQPELLWVLAELGAVPAADRLRRRLRIPVHATVHDTYEFSRFTLPRRYYPVYYRSAVRLLSSVTSFDTVSEALRAHIVSSYGGPPDRSVVFPPSVSRTAPAASEGLQPAQPACGIRRIVLCGSMRILEREWLRFLSLLSRLPASFEILAFVDRESFFNVPLPANVLMRFEAYLPDEESLIRRFREAAPAAAYLGLTRLPQQAWFSRYSLSSKLAAYTAAALPVIVDGPAESEAWRLVNAYGAGVLCGDDDTAATTCLGRLFGADEDRRSMSRGSARLCSEKFDLERNMKPFRETLSASAAGGGAIIR